MLPHHHHVHLVCHHCLAPSSALLRQTRATIVFDRALRAVQFVMVPRCVGRYCHVNAQTQRDARAQDQLRCMNSASVMLSKIVAGVQNTVLL
jgi:hypothetical protein